MFRGWPLPLLAGAAALLLSSRPAAAGPLAEAERLYARYRTTLSHDDLAAADAAVQAGLDAAPGDYELRKFRLRLLLPHHDFEGLRREAQTLKKERPDDADLDGALGDANFDLGDYPAAFAAYERFAAKKPSTASFSRIALAREVAGDLKGAVQSMDLAADSARASDAEGFAWCRARSARLLLKLNRYADAEGRLVEALRRVPDHALPGGRGRDRGAQGALEPATRLAERPFALEPEAGVAAASWTTGTRWETPRARRARRRPSPTSTRSSPRTTARPPAARALLRRQRRDGARLAMTERELRGRKDVWG